MINRSCPKTLLDCLPLTSWHSPFSKSDDRRKNIRKIVKVSICRQHKEGTFAPLAHLFQGREVLPPLPPCSGIPCKLPSVSSQRYGLNSLSFRGSLLWNTIDDEIKLSPSLEVFKKKVRSWNGISCTCFIGN